MKSQCKKKPPFLEFEIHDLKYPMTNAPLRFKQETHVQFRHSFQKNEKKSGSIDCIQQQR